MQRLKTRPQFQATMSAGTIARTQHFALHRMELVPVLQDMAANPSTGPGSSDPQALFGIGAVREQAWLGAMVPKRWARRSVTRHTIKRQIYAVAADHEAALQRAAHVVRLRSGFDRKQFVSATSDLLKATVRKELQQLFASGVRRLKQEQQAPAKAPDLNTNSAPAVDGDAPAAPDPIANRVEMRP
ncbi:MAG: ribonuclease P protein component [Comamonas sp.]|nr:ribonuclease P protein component [Comamonas sp.]